MIELDIDGYGHEFRILDLGRRDYGCGSSYGYADGDGGGSGLHVYSNMDSDGYGSGHRYNSLTGERVNIQDGDPSEW